MTPRTAALLLLVLGAMLAGGNLAVAWTRDTVPRSIAGVVTAKHARHEKHPGEDDVLLLEVDSAAPIQVERALFERIAVGDRIEKVRWSRVLRVNGTEFGIPVSVDLHGMSIAMPMLFALLLLIVIRAIVPRRSHAEATVPTT